MVIKGIQKLTCLDYPDKLATVVFTGGCNYKCPFCHNGEIACKANTVPTISDSEIMEIIKNHVGKIDGIVISGGEPTLQSDLLDFMQSIKELGLLVKLDTNGTNTKVLNRAIDRKLVDYVAMDIKNNVGKYSDTTGVSDTKLYNVIQSVQILKQEKIPYEFRTTVVKELHTIKDILEIAIKTVGSSPYYLQQFVDSPSCLYNGFHSYSDSDMQRIYRAVKEHCPNAHLRGIEEG